MASGVTDRPAPDVKLGIGGGWGTVKGFFSKKGKKSEFF